MNDQPTQPLKLPEALAGFADGELNPAARRQLLDWLTEHPEAFNILQEQESLAPGNATLWQSVAPPMPAARQWDATFDAISRAALPRATPFRFYRYLGPVMALAGMTAAILVVVFLERATPQAAVVRVAPPALKTVEGIDREDLVYRVATDDDVQLIQLPEAAAHLIVVGRHPMADVPLSLALAADVQLLNFGPDEQGNLPDIEDTQGPDISMLWAPSGKP